ncbi:MAG: DUF6603 domain-containing protein, partial [Candidatus Promineifilaceae bacterium]|nr:DUF6603 domain-containing protein [Candidatus Promineifilaceae bacterium]
MKSNFNFSILTGILDILEPLRVAADSVFYLQDLVGRIGWDLDEISGFSLNELSQFLQLFNANFESLVNDIEANPPDDLDGLMTMLENVQRLFEDIKSLALILSSDSLVDTPQLDDFVTDLIEYLSIIYVKIKHPVFYHLAVLLTIIRDSAELPFSAPVIDQQGKVIRFPHRRPQLHLNRLPDLIMNPSEIIKEEYFDPISFSDETQAFRAANKLFSRLDALLSELGLNVVFSHNPAYGVDYGEEGNRLAAGILTIFAESDIEDIDMGVSLALSPVTTGNLGLVFIPFGTLSQVQSEGAWQISFDMTAGIQAFAVGSNGMTMLAGADTATLKAGFEAIRELEEGDDSGAAIGGTKGTRLEIASMKFSGDSLLSSSDMDLLLAAEIKTVELIIDPANGDGFLQKILPSEGVRTDFDLNLSWSNKKGLHFGGSAGLDAEYPIQKSIMGIVDVHSIYMALKTDSTRIQFIIAVSIGAQIGPVQALVARVGLDADVSFPKNGGNLGLADLAFGFKFPTTIGLSIEAAGITGGGFLAIDPPNYAGMLQLSYRNEIDLTAFALITTELPDGQKGFSLVIQILAEFQPIQIGLGFALTGVGGLIGINRQIDEEAMKQAFKTHALDAFLFPKNPIKDAVKIIQSIQTVMPPRDGYHVFGPMVQLYWGGSVRLVQFEVGVFIQIGGPLKIIIIGQAWSHLPQGDNPRLRINVDVFGIIDFGEERLAVNATLYDSKILTYTLDGQMAIRADWSSGEESFALSVGGFHPRFQDIPPGFPQLRRLVVAIGSGNPRLTLSMYLAITPNTLQIGARLDLWAKKKGFTISGGASFDALFTFSPFSFLVIISIWVNIKRSFVDLGAWLELELSGPNPLIAAGYVKFKVGWFSKKVRFRKQFGDKKPEPLPVVSPVAALQAELENERVIRFQLPDWAAAAFIFAETAEDKIDPLADIKISQNAVPLNLTLERFGGGRPPDGE